MLNKITASMFVSVMMITTPVLLTGCDTATYKVKEKFGIEKRDTLVGRVKSVAKSQEKTKEEFEDALEVFLSVVEVEGGDLLDSYNRLNKAYVRADKKAQEVRERVVKVKRVARDLFREWEGELNTYSDNQLRILGKQKLNDTRQKYAVLVSKMDAAVASMNPVLRTYNDRVLYLKHNLNARAITGLNSETAIIEADVARLIIEMQHSISAADVFIQEMSTE